jgi:hypothetical protein
VRDQSVPECPDFSRAHPGKEQGRGTQVAAVPEQTHGTPVPTMRPPTNPGLPPGGLFPRTAWLRAKPYLAHPELSLLVISRGDIEANRELVREHGLTFPVATQQNWEVSRDYGIFAAPIAFLIDEWGVTIGNVAIGSESVLSLIQAAIDEESRQRT